jgi:hypothetical protein
MFPLAHAGHWLINVAYFIPVLGFVGFLGYTTLKERRAEKREGQD